MTTDNAALKQVTAADIGGFVNTIHALFKRDELGKGTKDQLNDALRSVGNDFGAGDIVDYASMTNWLSAALADNKRAQADQSDEVTGSPLQTLSLEQMMNGERGIGTSEIFGDLERAVDRVTGNSMDEITEEFIRIIALIRACEDDNVRDLLISKVLDYAYTRTGHQMKQQDDYINGLFAQKEDEKGGEANE